MEDYTGDGKSSVSPIVQTVNNYYWEAHHAKEERMQLNARNYNVYHLKQDWSHKLKGQSKEFLAKQAVATEQLTSFIQQALIDLSHWFEVIPETGVENPKIEALQIEKLLKRQLDKNNIAQFAADTIKTGLLGSLMIVKVHGVMKEKVSFKVDRGILGRFRSSEPKLFRVKKPIWELKLDLVRPEDFYPDPTGQKLYCVQRIQMDYATLLEIAKANPDDYDMDEVKACASMGADEDDQRQKKYRETGQNAFYTNYRKPVSVKECWGNILDPHTGEILYENVVCAIANNQRLIRPPKPNPFWHNQMPYVYAPILRVPHSEWGKAVMDAPSMHNLAANELYNLMVDASLQSAFGIRQLREDWLADPQQVNEGIVAGTTLSVTSSCPPGAKVLERIDTGALPPEAINMFNMVDKEFQQSALSNDIRMGTLPSRNVKATEIVASQNSITGLFNGIVKVIEKDFLAKVLDLSWQTVAQHQNDLDQDEVKAILGENPAKALSNMSPKEIFAQTSQGHRFKVFGLSSILNKVNDFQKISTLLQTVFNAPVLAQEFMKKYSPTKLMGEIIKSLDIDEEKLTLSPEEQAQVQAQMQQAQQIQQMQTAQEQNGQQGGQKSSANASPDMMSQIPQMGNMSQQNLPKIHGITNP